MDEVLKFFTEIKKRLEKLENNFTIFVQGWTTPTFLNAWANYSATFNSCGYFRDPHGIVHLRGLVSTGTIGAAIFQLPAKYRPIKQCLFSTTSSSGACRLDVYPTGEVIPVSGANAWFALDGITFRAEQ